MALVIGTIQGPLDRRVVAWGLVLLGYATWRTFRPLDLTATTAASRGSILLEAGLAFGAVLTTGAWQSPFVFCLMCALVAGGFANGFKFVVQTAVAGVLAIGALSLLTDSSAEGLQSTGQWSVELLLVAVLAGYARHLFGQAEERHSEALSRMSQLTEANGLLVALQRVAQTLPASLSLEEVVTSTVARLRALIDCDLAVVLLHDQVSSRWSVAASAGAGGVRSLEKGLPAPAAEATTNGAVVAYLAPGESLGEGDAPRSGLYAPLRARGGLVGLLALEHQEPARYGLREVQVLERLVEPAAVAVDNALLFRRLRTMGAEEERTRIARDIHDGVGQSLAGVAFRLDGITAKAAGSPLGDDLQELRAGVRAVVTEVRHTLSDLRTDVSGERGLVQTLDEFLERVEDRTGLSVTFMHQAGARLPVVQEREIWRIAHEAVVNVERHAGARHLRVRWRCDGRTGVLTVADDGVGFSPGGAGRPDSFGLIGMRERAEAIGASLEVQSEPGVGTMIECRVGV